MDLKFISSKAIFDKVARDFNMGDSGILFDGAQWIIDALEQIGTLQIYETCKKKVTVTDNKVPLFCEIEKLGNVYVNGKCICWTNYNPCCVEMPALIDDAYKVSLDPPYLRFNFTDVEIEIEYMAFPIDTDGMPMVIDNVYVREALSWYIVFKMLLSGSTHPVLDIKAASAMWVDFKAKASNSLLMPYASTIDETFKAFRSPTAYPVTK